MKPNNDKLEDLLTSVKFDDEPSTAHRDQLEQRLVAAFEPKDPQPRMFSSYQWRTTMKSTYTRFATAAAVAVAAVVVLTVTVGPWSSDNAAWAIEQSIEALNRAQTVHVIGTCTDSLVPDADGKTRTSQQQRDFEIWARVSQKQDKSGDLRFEASNGYVIVVKGQTSHVYYPEQHVVQIKDGKAMAISPWLGGDLIDTIKKHTQDWEVTYGKDDAGRSCAFVTFSYAPQNGSWWLAFDTETNLLVRFKQWNNTKRQGEPTMSATDIRYDVALDDSLFEFRPPEGAKMIDERLSEEELAAVLNDPGKGMSTEGMSDDEASASIVERFWKAMIGGDRELAGKLFPGAALPKGKRRFALIPPVEFISVGKTYPYEGHDSQSVRECTVRFDRNQTRLLKMIVRFRQIGGKRSCVISHIAGSQRLEEAD